MNDLTPITLEQLVSPEKQTILSKLASAIPDAVAKPYLDAKRIDAQQKCLQSIISANLETRKDIMRTMRELAAAKQLTPEISQYLFAALNQTLIQYPF